ncbi:hypothetical protein E0485_05500 [Paenibacillus albiflavus]|uniref:Uncharacterized protein n=1 Tax=Paenibacillus albiflavus TaxID=2545760 RepID=A0A4R4EJ94_9BACL|nr:hypothetical protein [Paenibacillus albiflavus]TCZ79320.1 hypothetical protein E0485_05500 [Paenibacillus albiflavus]
MKKVIYIFIFVLIIAACSDKHRKESAIVNLDFKPYINSVELQVIDSDYELIKFESFSECKAMLFQLNSDSEIYAGIFINNKLYSIGPVSMTSTPEELLSISETDVFGKKLITFSGILGANYARTLYVEVKEDSVSPIVSIDGNIIEIDLDHDNSKEIVSTIGTIPETCIYKLIDDQIYIANVNESLDAQAISFNQKNNKFEVYSKPNEPQFYIFSNGGLKVDE